jgi:pilus assembly protein Flp/PilA
MVKLMRKVVKDCSGPTAIEYCLIAGLVAIVTIAGLTTLGTTINSKFNYVATKIAS